MKQNYSKSKDNSKRILFITNNYTPYSAGVVTSIQATVRELQLLGYEVFIVTLDFLGKDHNDPDYVLRVPCPIKFKFKTNYVAVPWRAQSYITERIKELTPSIIHVHHPFFLGEAGRKAAKKLGIPIIFTYHTMYEHYLHYAPLPQTITKPLVTNRVLNFCKAVDGIVAPSSSIARYLYAQNIATPIEVIPSGIRSFFLEEKKENKIKKNGYFSLISVGRFVKEKNLELLLDVYAQLPKERFDLTLVGYGNEYESLKKYAYHVHGFTQEQVRFIIKPDQNELRSLYQQADLFLFSSVSDTQGLVLAEAMACGTPVVAVDGAGQRDIIDQGVNGYIVQSVDEMAEKVQFIAADKNLHKQLCLGASRTACEYDPSVLVARLEKFYKKVMEQ